MPRGKSATTADRIAKLDVQIARTEAQLATLKQQKQELLEQEKREKLDKLLEAVDEKGLDIDRVIELIQNAPMDGEAQ